MRTLSLIVIAALALGGAASAQGNWFGVSTGFPLGLAGH